MNDGFALSLSEQRRAAGPIKQCALGRNSWGREGTWALLPQSGSPTGLLLLLFLQKISGEAVEAVIRSSLLNGEMRHSNRFDTHLVSYQVTLLVLPGLTIVSPSLSVSLSLSLSLSISSNPLY